MKKKLLAHASYEQDMSKFPLNHSKIPTCEVEAYIVPEPNNVYDKT